MKSPLRHLLLLSLLSPLGSAAPNVQADAPAHADAISPQDWSALIAALVESNPEGRLYAASIEAARAGRKAASAAADPSLTVEFGRKRAQSATGALLGEGNVWSVTASQTFEWPGRLALRKAIANCDVSLAELGMERFKAALRARAGVLAFGLHATASQAEATREVAERFAALKATLLAREPGGLTPALEARALEAREIALQRRATADALAAQAALVELNQLRGSPADAPLRVAPVSFRFAPPPERSALLAAAREHHFESRARRLEIEQQGFELRLARHERKPALTLSPYFSRESAGDRETTVGIGLSVPLPIGARTTAHTEQATARLRQAEAALAIIERERDRTVLVAAETYAAKTAEAARWTPEAAARLRDSAALADRHYRLGAVPLATYLELQSAYIEAIETLYATQREALEAAFLLQELTGAPECLATPTRASATTTTSGVAPVSENPAASPTADRPATAVRKEAP